MRNFLIALLLAAGPARAAEFMGKVQRPANAAGDAALCAGLFQSADRIKLAFVKGSTFPDQVYGAFSGEGSGDATTHDYLVRGEDLYQLTATVSDQCRAALQTPGTSAAEAAAVRRRANEAKRTADLYLDLPATVQRIDDSGSEAQNALREQFVTAMHKIADGGNYSAAQTIADSARAALSRLRR